MTDALTNDDEARLLALDHAWNDAYLRNERSGLAGILADDFAALDPHGKPVTKAALMVNPPKAAATAVFSEKSVQMFGDTGVTRGRLTADLGHQKIDQRFTRIFARRNGQWRAVSVAVTPVPA